VLLERVVNAVELLFGHPDLLGRGLREPEVGLRPGCLCENEKSADERGAEHPAFHGLASLGRLSCGGAGTRNSSALAPALPCGGEMDRARAGSSAREAVGREAQIEQLPFLIFAGGQKGVGLALA